MSKATLTKHTSAATIIGAPLHVLFDIITDHENTPSWIDQAKRVTLIEKGGTGDNGVGAIRKVQFKPKSWSNIIEEVTAYEPARGFDYRIVSGMPGLVNHLGQWKLEDLGHGKTAVTWDVTFVFKKYHWFILFLSKFITSFAAVQTQALQGLEKKACEHS